MPAVTSVHNEGRWIGRCWVCDEVGPQAETPAQSWGQAQLFSLTKGRSSKIHTNELRVHSTMPVSSLPLPNHSLLELTCSCHCICPLSAQKSATFSETNVNVVIWAVRSWSAKSLQRPHTAEAGTGAEERQVKTERGILPKCQLGFYMKLRAPWNMCSMCPISCWAALFLLFCDKSWDLSRLPHLFHCSDFPCYCCLQIVQNLPWSDQQQSDVTFSLSCDTDTCETTLNNSNNRSMCTDSVITTVQQHRASICFHYVEKLCVYHDLNSAQQQELSADIMKGSA